jgi:hypothetical protein
MISHHVALTSTLAIYDNDNFEPDESSLDVLQGTKSVLSLTSWSDFLKLRALIKQHPSYPSPEIMAQILKKEMESEREDPTGIGGVFSGYGDQRKMELLMQAGFSPSESAAIYSSHAAKYLGRENIIGTVVLAKGHPVKGGLAQVDAYGTNLHSDDPPLRNRFYNPPALAGEIKRRTISLADFPDK